MNQRVAYLLPIAFLLHGCAPNMISMGKFYNSVEMISPDGDVYTGKVTFDASTKDGMIEIPNTLLGNLLGNFSTTDTGYSGSSSGVAAALGNSGNTILVPSVSQQAITSNTNKGNAFLKSNGKVALRCSVSLSFPVDTLKGGMFAVGNGICFDNDKNQYYLQFIRNG